MPANKVLLITMKQPDQMINLHCVLRTPVNKNGMTIPEWKARY